MAEEAARYDLGQSKVNIGELYPLLVDKYGNIIDGFHRLEKIPDWRQEKLEHIDTPTKLWLARIIANLHRRQVSKKERVVQITELSRCLIAEGVPKEKLIDKLHEFTTFSIPYLYKILPDEFKRRPGAGPKMPEPLRKGMTSEEVLSRYNRRYEDEFLVVQLVAYAGMKVSQAKSRVKTWRRDQSGASSQEDREVIEKFEKKRGTVDRRDATVQTFAKLMEYYPSSIIDQVMKITPSTNLPTLIKYCRRYVGKLHEKTPSDLKQALLQEFLS